MKGRPKLQLKARNAYWVDAGKSGGIKVTLLAIKFAGAPGNSVGNLGWGIGESRARRMRMKTMVLVMPIPRLSSDRFSRRLALDRSAFPNLPTAPVPGPHLSHAVPIPNKS